MCSFTLAARGCEPYSAFSAASGSALAARRDGAAHEVSRVQGLRAAWQYVDDVAKRAPRPELWQVLLLAFLINPAHRHGWRRYDVPGAPTAAKVGPVMEVWHARLATWTPEQAYDALLKVHPFGKPSDRDVGLCVYNWLRRTWRNPARARAQKRVPSLAEYLEHRAVPSERDDAPADRRVEAPLRDEGGSHTPVAAHEQSAGTREPAG